MKFLTLVIVLSALLMTGAASTFASGMGTSMGGAFDGSGLMVLNKQVGCPIQFCQMNSMGDTSECLVHCISAYESQFDLRGAVLPVGFSFLLLAGVILLFSWRKILEPRSFFDKRQFYDIFNKLLLHRSLASVVIRD